MRKIINMAELGRSMIEIVGVLAIMTIMSAGAFVMIRSAMASQRRNTVIDDVSKIVTGVRTLFADQDDLSELSDKGDDVMDAMAVGQTCPYDGCKYELSLNGGDNTNQTFNVKVTSVPRRDCIVLKSKSWPDVVDVDSDCDRGWVELQYNK